MAVKRGERSSGRFWLAGHPDAAVGGWLDLTGRWPVLELAEPLTPDMREVSRTRQPDGSELVKRVPADDDVDPDTVTVHGMVRSGPGRVTLVGASTAGRQRVLFGRFPDPGAERFRADYALLGGHEPGHVATFAEARLRVRHLDVWAYLPGVTLELATDRSRAVLTHEEPDSESVELREPAGRLVLDSVLTVAPLTVRGGRLTRTAELRLELDEPLTVEQLWGRFVRPVQALLTLALDADCAPVQLDVRAAGDARWLEVAHPALEDPADEEPLDGAPLLIREHLPLTGVALWLQRADVLAPVPALVSGVAISSGQRLESQLLDLATAVEGLHRRLRPRDRPMSRGAADRARRAAAEAVDPAVRDRVSKSLGHLHDPFYNERLYALVESVGKAVPGLTGDTEQWAGLVAAARNGFAHLPLRQPRDDGWRESLVLRDSLRWLLSAVLLLEAGVPPATLAERLEWHQPYLHQRRRARRWLPDVYEAPDGQQQAPPGPGAP